MSVAAAVRARVITPLQTLSNLLAALREGDYSIRARDAGGDDALGEVALEINALGETLRAFDPRAVVSPNIWGYLWGKEAYGAMLFATALTNESIADALAMPQYRLASREEAFGNVFAEAMASGLPIVGSTVGGIPELVEHGKNGFLVPPREPRALAAAIRLLADNADLRAEIGRRNRVEAESNLSWARVTTRYLSTYNGVLRRAPSRVALAELPSSTW